MTRPPVQPPHPWHFPEPATTRLNNGLTLQVFHRPGQYVVSAALVADLPLTQEPSTLEGVATLTARCLDEGTRTHPGLRFTESLESQGAVFSASAGYSATQVFLDVPATRLERVLPLLAEAVTEPLLADADVERHRDLRLAEIAQTLAHPSQRATLAFRQASIDAQFRSSRPAGGERSGVTRISGDDVRRFHAEHYSPAGATLILAGDFVTDPVPAAAEAFARWSGPGTQPRHEEPTGRIRTCVLIDRPQSVQADVRLGRFGIDRSDPRWPDLQLGTYALGGAFLSRLNRVLREERGYTYGVHLVNQPLRHGGLVTLQGSFRTEVVAAALAEAVELIDVSGEPFTTAEINDAANYAIGVAPLRYATASGVTEQVAALTAVGLGSVYVDEYAAALARVTPTAATAAVASLLPPDDLSLVVVGDAAAVAPALRSQGWPLEVVPADA